MSDTNDDTADDEYSPGYRAVGYPRWGEGDES